MTIWTRKIWLALLLLSWALAIGLHDFVLDDHDHDAHSPETVIAQVWNSDSIPATPVPPPLVALAAVILVTLVLLIRLELRSIPERPESRHSPPRPPTLKNLLFRGPPALTLPAAKSRKCEMIPCPQNTSRCSGWLSASPGAPSLSTAVR